MTVKFVPIKVSLPILITSGIIIILSLILCCYLKSLQRKIRVEQGYKISAYKPKKSNSCEACAICLDDFHPMEKIVVSRCQHSFHNKCLERWLEVKNSCPICLAPIKKITNQDGATLTPNCSVVVVASSMTTMGLHNGFMPSSTNIISTNQTTNLTSLTTPTPPNLSTNLHRSNRITPLSETNNFNFVNANQPINCNIDGQHHEVLRQNSSSNSNNSNNHNINNNAFSQTNSSILCSVNYEDAESPSLVRSALIIDPNRCTNDTSYINNENIANILDFRNLSPEPSSSYNNQAPTTSSRYFDKNTSNHFSPRDKSPPRDQTSSQEQPTSKTLESHFYIDSSSHEINRSDITADDDTVLNNKNGNIRSVMSGGDIKSLTNFYPDLSVAKSIDGATRHTIINLSDQLNEIKIDPNALLTADANFLVPQFSSHPNLMNIADFSLLSKKT